MPQNGWEFYILDPTDKAKYPFENTQNEYNRMYKQYCDVVVNLSMLLD